MAGSELELHFDVHKDFDPTSSLDIAYLASIGIKDRSGFADWDKWSASRKKIAIEQMFYKARGIEVGEIDGYVGPQTKYAREVYAEKAKGNGKVDSWRDDPKVEARPWWEKIGSWVSPTPVPLESGASAAPASPTPQTSPSAIGASHTPNKNYHPEDFPKQGGVSAFYGEVGKNQVTCKLPFPMVIAWNTKQTVHSYSCHKLVKEPMEALWNKVLEEYGLEEIKKLRLNYFGGCLNVRKMRGGSAWSMHAWGIAVDIDPERNALNMNHKQATMAKPEYDKFWEIVYDHGAISLGKERDYDWMHFQWARL